MPFTIQLRADLVSAAHGGRAARGGVPRGLDRRRERQPEDPRCDEQGHPRGRERRGARASCATRASASDSFCSSAISARSSTTSSRRAGWSRARGPTTSVSAWPIHCRARSSTSWSRSSSGAKRNWQESNDLEMMFQGTYTSEFYRAVRNLLHDQVTTPRLPSCAQSLERAHRPRGGVPPQRRARPARVRCTPRRALG